MASPRLSVQPGKGGAEPGSDRGLYFMHTAPHVLTHGKTRCIGIVAGQDFDELPVPAALYLITSGDIVKPVEDQQLILFQQIAQQHTAAAFGNAHMQNHMGGLNRKLKFRVSGLFCGDFNHFFEAVGFGAKLLPIGGSGSFAK